MRIMIKGGVWKNTEDEILKAAVMKYGKNQWARISSLLVRKSAKQCKARWYEWLDPSIKKTEWTREEDEKLLHLARLMPTQWRTIAPIVGRTPSQCLERYEKLLDAACVKDENYEANEDPRKLRPGEIDPNPESKPARPDPVDMDEDEKEMLSEARARLANTRGKKAKRKAREKQLEEARRLASLQKRRELKAAGIETRLRRRKRRGIDYNAEIPFEKRPPPGFYNTADEDRSVEQPKFPTTIEELEGRRRADVEAQLRKQDIARNKIAQRQDAPSAIMQANKLNDPEAIRKRAKLMLPPPQISDHELEEIAKMGYAGDMLSGEDFAQGSTATRALLGNYSQTPQHRLTPLRTPQRTPGGNVDTVMMEAENLAKLRESQTPLLGGENPELHPSDFSGITPKKRDIRTPNPMATPLMTPGAMGLTPRGGMTPSSGGYSAGMTPRGTPFRDELHINDDLDLQDIPKPEHRQAEIRKNLRSGLLGLPLPKNEYQIVRKPILEENEEVEEQIEEDMSDRIARERAEEQARQEALLRKRSKVLQRELPRPPVASLELLRSLLIRGGEDKSSFVPPTLFEQANELINRELLALLQYDNAKYPLDENADKEKKKGSKRASNAKSAVCIPEIEDFDEDELKEADSLIKEETEFLRVAMGHEEESLDDFVKARDACQEDLMFFPARNTYGLASVAANSEKLDALQNEFENLKRRLDEEAKKATKSEQKAKVLTHGFQVRAGKLWSQIEATFTQMDTAGTELECFEALQRQEQVGASYRVKYLIDEVNKQRELERTLQRRYGDLLIEYERIQKFVEAHFCELRKQEEIRAKQEAEEKKMHEAIVLNNISIAHPLDVEMQEPTSTDGVSADREKLKETNSLDTLTVQNEKQEIISSDMLSVEEEIPEAIALNHLSDAHPLDEEIQVLIGSDGHSADTEQEEAISSGSLPVQNEKPENMSSNMLSAEEEKMQETVALDSLSDPHPIQDEMKVPTIPGPLSGDRETQKEAISSPVQNRKQKISSSNMLSAEEDKMQEAVALNNLSDAHPVEEEMQVPTISDPVSVDREKREEAISVESLPVQNGKQSIPSNLLSAEEEKMQEAVALSNLSDSHPVEEEMQVPTISDLPSVDRENQEEATSLESLSVQNEKQIIPSNMLYAEEEKMQETIALSNLSDAYFPEEEMQETIHSDSLREDREEMQETIHSDSLREDREKQEEAISLESPLVQNEKQEGIISSNRLSAEEEKTQEAIALSNLSGAHSPEEEMQEIVSSDGLSVQEVQEGAISLESVPVESEKQEGIISSNLLSAEEGKVPEAIALNNLSETHYLEEELQETISFDGLSVDREKQEESISLGSLPVQNEKQAETISSNILFSENQMQVEGISPESPPIEKEMQDDTCSKNLNSENDKPETDVNSISTEEEIRDDTGRRTI